MSFFLLTGASTDTYDSVVWSSKWDGRISLRHVESRKPPQQAVHWKSTSRLASPNLVGLVKLKQRGQPLVSTDRVYWAEIIRHENDKYERFGFF